MMMVMMMMMLLTNMMSAPAPRVFLLWLHWYDGDDDNDDGEDDNYNDDDDDICWKVTCSPCVPALAVSTKFFIRPSSVSLVILIRNEYSFLQRKVFTFLLFKHGSIRNCLKSTLWDLLRPELPSAWRLHQNFHCAQCDPETLKNHDYGSEKPKTK